MQGAALGSWLQVCIGNILQELLWFLLRWEDVCAKHHHHYKCGHWPIAVEPLCPGFIPIRDSIFRSGGERPITMCSSTLWSSVSQSVTMWYSTNGMNRTCSTERVDGRPDRDSLPTNRIIIKDYENWCFLASIVAVFLFFALSIKEFVMQCNILTAIDICLSSLSLFNNSGIPIYLLFKSGCF